MTIHRIDLLAEYTSGTIRHAVVLAIASIGAALQYQNSAPLDNLTVDDMRRRSMLLFDRAEKQGIVIA